MSVVSTVISKVCTAHASDSFITERKTDGSYHVQENKQSKIVHVPQFRGAMAYWGLAQYAAHRWPTRKWLSDRAQHAGQSSDPEQFARDFAGDLTIERLKLKLTDVFGDILDPSLVPKACALVGDNDIQINYSGGFTLRIGQLD